MINPDLLDAFELFKNNNAYIKDIIFIRYKTLINHVQ